MAAVGSAGGDESDGLFELRELRAEDLRPELLSGFDRRQEVRRVFRLVDGKKTLRDNPFVDDWDAEHKRLVVEEDFTRCLAGGGFVLGAFRSGELVAFASMPRRLLGRSRRYAELMQLHVSRSLRHSGLGRRLFLACADKARAWGAESLYISAHSAEETQAFYEAMGCVPAAEIDERLAALEPWDLQLEYRL